MDRELQKAIRVIWPDASLTPVEEREKGLEFRATQESCSKTYWEFSSQSLCQRPTSLESEYFSISAELMKVLGSMLALVER